MSEMQKELDQKVTQLTDEEMGAVNGGDGAFSNIEYVRCIKCNRAMGVRQPGEKATGFCARCVKKYKYNIK